MNAEEIRKVNTAGSYPWDDERPLLDQISTLSGLVKELTAQVAELNAKTPSLRMQVSMAAMQAELSSPSDFPINLDQRELLAA